MGGGAAMRAAGKLTGMGVFNGGLRGGTSVVPPAEQALRNVSRPVASVVSTGGPPGADLAAIQKASWEADWDFAGVEEDLLVDSSPEPIARVVFDVAPTLQEAKDATADLKEALDKVYLSSPESGAYGNGGPAFRPPLLASSDNLETNPSDSRVALVPPATLNAFRLFSESPKVQSVVASIAADPNVWGAVMQNDELKEFMMSQQSSAVIQDEEHPRNFDESSDSCPGGDTASEFGGTAGEHGDTENAGSNFVEKIKRSVAEMVSNASNFFQNLFGSSPAGRTSADAGAGAGAGAGASNTEKTMAASLMGLAIMVIMVVVFKRV